MCGQVRAEKGKGGFEYAKLNCRDMGYLNSVGNGDCEIKGYDKREIISSRLCRGEGRSYMQGRQPTHAHFFDFKVGNIQSKPGALPGLPTTGQFCTGFTCWWNARLPRLTTFAFV